MIGEKQAYSTPRLTVYGGVQEITQQMGRKTFGSGDAIRDGQRRWRRRDGWGWWEDDDDDGCCDRS